MLKYQVIRAFVAVWCAVCLSYTGVRTAFGILSAGPDTPDEHAEVEASVASPPMEVRLDENPTRGVEPGETLVVGESDEAKEAPIPEAWDVPTTPDTIDSSVSGVEAAPDAVDATGTVEVSQGTVPDIPSEGEEVVWGEPPVETAQEEEVAADDAPTLEEYLSSYTCGSCRRNCSLSNPSCRRGSRLAQLRAQEYYELFGI